MEIYRDVREVPVLAQNQPFLAAGELQGLFPKPLGAKSLKLLHL